MINKVAYVQHVPGHSNSLGNAAPWVVKSHETGKILSSHSTEAEARAHLRQMEIHKNIATSLTFQEITKESGMLFDEVKRQAITNHVPTWFDSSEDGQEALIDVIREVRMAQDMDELCDALGGDHMITDQIINEGAKRLQLNRVAHCGPCTPLKMEAIRVLSDMHFELSNFDKKYLGTLAEQSEEHSSDPFIATLDEVVASIQSNKDIEGKLRKLKQISATLREVQNKIDEGEFKADQPKSEKKANAVPYNGTRPQDREVDPSENKNTGYGDRPGLFVEPKAGIEVGNMSPEVLQDMKDWLKELTWANMEPEDFDKLTPKQISNGVQKFYEGGVDQFIKDGAPVQTNPNQAIAKQDFGVLKKGQSVIITGSKGDKVFFYVEKDPSLVGIACRASFTPTARQVQATGFLKCHAALSKSPTFLTKLAEDLHGLTDPSVLDQLESIKQTISDGKARVVNQLPVSPTINARLRLNDAAQYFTLRNIIPTEKDTIVYIQASMAAHTGLPESTWPEKLVRQAMLSRKADAPVDWSDKLLLMQQWHLAGTMAPAIWEELMTLLDSDDFNEIRVGMDRLFEKASETVKKPESVAKPEQKTAGPIPTEPLDPLLPGQTRELQEDVNGNYHWVVKTTARLSKQVPNTLKGQI